MAEDMFSHVAAQIWKADPEVIKSFFMLNSTEHEISLGHKNKNTNN